MKPSPGQKYQSQTHRDERFYIEAVGDGDPESPEFFTVEFCHVDDIHDMSAPCFDLTGDEWNAFAEEHALILEP